MKNKMKVKIIIGSTRPNRFSEKVGKWIYDISKTRTDIDFEILDLLEYSMPFLDLPISPSNIKGDYPNEIVNKWAKKISESDGFIIISPEYNHSFSAVLKNALDCIYKEWNNKAVAFMSYGGVGGARAIEQLRLVAIELQMVPIRNSVHIFAPWNLLEKDNSLKSGVLDQYIPNANGLLDQLIWWVKTIKLGKNNQQKL